MPPHKKKRKKEKGILKYVTWNIKDPKILELFERGKELAKQEIVSRGDLKPYERLIYRDYLNFMLKKFVQFYTDPEYSAEKELKIMQMQNFRKKLMEDLLNEC